MNAQLTELLNSKGMRNTRQRHVLFDVLNRQPAITSSELFAKISAHMDRASFYRTLNLFRELGVIHDVVIGGSRKIELTDRFNPHHHHLTCESCNRTVAIHDHSFEELIESLAQKHGFTHTGHSFDLSGQCAECDNNQNTDE